MVLFVFYDLVIHKLKLLFLWFVFYDLVIHKLKLLFLW